MLREQSSNTRWLSRHSRVGRTSLSPGLFRGGPSYYWGLLLDISFGWQKEVQNMRPPHTNENEPTINWLKRGHVKAEPRKEVKESKQ